MLQKKKASFGQERIIHWFFSPMCMICSLFYTTLLPTSMNTGFFHNVSILLLLLGEIILLCLLWRARREEEKTKVSGALLPLPWWFFSVVKGLGFLYWLFPIKIPKAVMKKLFFKKIFFLSLCFSLLPSSRFRLPSIPGKLTSSWISQMVLHFTNFFQTVFSN